MRARDTRGMALAPCGDLAMPGAMDRNDLRDALGSFATGVTIVTARDQAGNPVGLTANSFNSVSLEPPMVLWSLALNSPNLPAFRAAKSWAVHILGANQEDLSNRFATRGANKFEGLEVVDGPEGAPEIAECAARFGCKATFEYDGGDHAIFVGEVVDFHRKGSEPLIFHGGRYNRLRPDDGEIRPRDFENEAEFGRYFLGHLFARVARLANAELKEEYERRGLDEASYTLLVMLGIEDGDTRDGLETRARRSDIRHHETALDNLLDRGMAVVDTSSKAVTLTDDGQRVLSELLAVAKAAQLHLENLLSRSELDALRDMLGRIVSSPD